MTETRQNLIDLALLTLYPVILFGVGVLAGYFWASEEVEILYHDVLVERSLEDCYLVFTHPSPRGLVIMYDCEEAP